MSLNRYDKKRDANEKPLVAILLQFGAEWEPSPPLDGWCNWRGAWTPVEIKNPEGRDRYTKSQIAFMAMCKRRGIPVWTWRTERDVFESLGARRTA